MSKKFISNRIGRFGQLGKSLTKASAHLALEKLEGAVDTALKKKDEVENLHRKVKAAKELVASMGELKGALMKLGQMLSITEDLVLPPEVSKIFRELQKNAPPMKDSEIDQVFIKSFGKKPEELFATFDRKPVAAASIGQVHLGTLEDGTQVAIKVQYPKIAKAIKNDFQNLDTIKKFVTLLFPKAPNIDSYLVELKRSLAEECNYHKEREWLDVFRKECQEKFPNVHIPKAYADYSSETVLTMEFMEGDSFIESKSYTQEEKDKLGQLLYDFHNFCFYNIQKLHTDPQYGNYLFTRDSIIVLDFGSVRSFSEEFVEEYILLLESIEKRDLETYRRVLLNFGFFDERDSMELFKNHLDMVADLYDPYNQEGKTAIPDVNPFDLVKTFVDKIELKGRRSPKEEFLLLDRAHLGLYTKLKGWKSSIDWVTTKNLGWQVHRAKKQSQE